MAAGFRSCLKGLVHGLEAALSAADEEPEQGHQHAREALGLGEARLALTHGLKLEDVLPDLNPSDQLAYQSSRAATMPSATRRRTSSSE